MLNDNTKVVRQHQMVVTWIRLRHMKRFNETKPNGFKISSNFKSNKNDINNNNDNNDNNNKMHRQTYGPHDNQYRGPFEVTQQPKAVN